VNARKTMHALDDLVNGVSEEEFYRRSLAEHERKMRRLNMVQRWIFWPLFIVSNGFNLGMIVYRIWFQR
jgi:hypothetical protein